MFPGRRVEHDARSRRYPAAKATVPQSVLWPHRAPVLDQFFVNACTGFALANCLNTTFFTGSRLNHHRYLTQGNALTLYSFATIIDEYAGSYPPDDTGSSPLGVCKAAQRMGYLSSFRHAFGFDHFAAALQLSPLIVGTNWYEDMTYPDERGFVRPTGRLADGHEYCALGVNYRSGYCTFINSWGPTFGRNGRFRISFDDFARLLDENGDATVPVGKISA